MSETIVIELAADLKHIARAGALAPDGTWLRSIAAEDLEKEAGSDAFVVLNGALVAAHRLALPPFTGNKLLKILPGLMDEKLALMEGDRHFAVFEAPSLVAVPEDDKDAVAPSATDAAEKLVLVTDLSVMQSVVALVRGYGLSLVGVLPDYMLLPVPQAGTNAGLIAGTVVARQADGGGFAVESDVAEFMLEAGQTPETFGEKAWQRTLGTVLTATDTLLQGAFAKKGNVAAGFVWFRRAAILAAASLALWAGGAVYQAADNNSRAEAYYGEAEALFKDALPDVPRIVNMEAQMRRAVLATRQQAGGEFLALSDLAFRAVQGNEQTLLESLRYDNETGEMVLSVSFASFAEGETFKQALQGFGAQVVEGGSRQEGSRVFSELTIRRAS